MAVGQTDHGKSFSGLRFWSLFLAGLSLLDLAVMLVIVTIHAGYPASIPTGILTPLLLILGGMAGGSLVLSTLWFLLRYPQHRKVLVILLLITAGIMAAHLYTINTPTTANCQDTSKGVQGCIMDEVYYVPAAETLLSGAKCGPYLDNCNFEHPFLSKAFIAAGIAIFGDNTFGWRIFEALLGTASIPILFAIVWKVSHDATFAIFAAYLLAFETLFFAHSSIAVIDVQAVFFALLAFLCYLGNFHFWKLNRFVLAGILLGLAALSKETAIFLVAFLAVYNLLLAPGRRLTRVLSTVLMLAIVFVVFAFGLQLYASLFGNSSVHTFLDEIRFILSYGASLKVTPSSPGWVDTLLHTPITPLNWITYYSPIGYLVTTVTVTSGSTSFQYVSVGYYGITSDLEVWLTYVWIGYVGYLAYKGWRRAKSPILLPGMTATPETIQAGEPIRVEKEPSFEMAKFAVLWFFVTYVPYIFLYYLLSRVTYPYYMVPVVPAITIGCAYLLSRKSFPREIAYVFLAGVFLWFFLFYPDKSFLPTQLRVLLGH